MVWSKCHDADTKLNCCLLVLPKNNGPESFPLHPVVGKNNFFCNWHHMCLCMGGGGGLLLTVSTPGQALRQLISWYWCKRPLPRTPCPPYTHQARGGWLYLLSLAQHTLRRCRLGGSWGQGGCWPELGGLEMGRLNEKDFVRPLIS